MKKSKLQMELSQNARTVLEKRYLLKDEQGRVVETPPALFRRVAKSVSAVEGRRRTVWEERFFCLMASGRFIPNSPTLMNAGKAKGQLSACYVLPLGDSLEEIFETLKDAALIHQSGGGTGFSFSALRPKGSVVRSSQGVASGPVSYLRIFDSATETIKQGGTRRGANMGVLRIDHPDIVEFIECKIDQRSILNFNLSVGATDEFMRAVIAGTAFSLRDPRTGAEVKRIKARSLFLKIAEMAWATGDPGLVFLDRINLFNPTPKLGSMVSTNPCGEQPLLGYESCNLGSLNLGKYVLSHGKIDWKKLRADIWDAVRFLDNVIDVNHFPIAECDNITKRNRKIGLGVMGFADLLLLLGVPYDSADAVLVGEQVMSVLDREAKNASMVLASKRGAFPNWKGSMWEKLGFSPLRNATVSTVAPTGTISMIAGASSGIEPIFSALFYRHVLDGEKLVEVHPALKRLLGDDVEGVTRLDDGELRGLLGKGWQPTNDVSIAGHLRIQAAFQRHSDSAVSKTINLPQGASVEDVARAYQWAYELGCKGITIYRDQSRSEQVLNRAHGSVVCPSC